MTIRRHYRNSPITEAIIDIQIELVPGFSPEMLEPIHELFKADYPKREDLIVYQGQITVGAKTPVTTSQTKLGYLYRSHDGKYVLQTKINGFTLSRLAPYEHWEVFRLEAKRLWNIYKEITKPRRAVRIAIRTINRIDMPPPVVDLGEYFKTYPEVSRDLPQMLAGYLMQVLIPLEDIGATVSLIQASVPAPRPDISSINLDLDLFKQDNSEFDSDERIWGFLDRLRDKKNEIFESCITDRARSLFGGISPE